MRWLGLGLAAVLSAAGMAAAGAGSAATVAAAATAPTLDLKVLLIGSGSADPTTAAWAAALATEGVPYTEVDATGTSGSWTVTLPTLSSGTTGNFNGVVIADSPADFASGQLTALDTYESSFGVRQIDGYMFPSLGVTEASAGALDGTTATLTTAGLAAFPELKGTVSFATGTYGYGATVTAGAPFTSFLNNSAGNTLAGVYLHPGTDPQAGVSELSLFFDYNSGQTQWLEIAPGLINWVTQDTHLGLYRNYVEMDIDDTFTPDDAWSITNHTIDYSDADALRMRPSDVPYAAQWSQANHFRMDQLFNYASSIAAQSGDLTYDGAPTGTVTSDPLTAAFQATDPATNKSYTDDFGWISHTYDTPYMDVGCATQNYIEAELNENTSSIAAAPGATAGTGGLGLASSTDDSLSYGYQDPQVFVPGNHSGFADLVPGNPATVDPPDLDTSTAASTTGGKLAAGTYEYAVTDQFNASDSPSTDQSSAYVTAPITVSSPNNSVTLTWQSICHAANYLVYRAASPYTSWSLVGNLATPASATLPDNSSGNPTSTTDVTGGGELEQTFTDTGAAGTPAGFTTPPVQENAVEKPWEQNPYFVPAMEAVGITAVGDDASKTYPNPPTDEFGIGASYTGATYPAGSTFVDGTAQVVPRHPINIYYNNSTEAQAVDEYNTLYLPPSLGGQCDTSTTVCLTAPATFQDIVNQVVSQMFTFMLSNNPEPSYVHQTNLMGAPPGCATPTVCNAAPPATAPATADTTGDGLLYSVLNPLLADYNAAFNATTTPYEQLTEGQIATVLAEQAAWGDGTSGVSATETNGTVTVTNSGSAVSVPITVPAGTTVSGAAFGTAYGGQLSAWVNLATGATETLTETVLPSPWTDADVGSPAVAGSASYSNGVFTVNGSGADIWEGSDQFNYVSQPLTGNASIVARVTSQSDTDPWAKAGVMIKQSTTSGTSYALLGVTPGNGIAFQYGYNTQVAGGSYTFPNAWLKLTRTGNTITAFSSADGSTWTPVGATTISLTDPVTIGLFNCAHNASALNTATFDNVSVTAGGSSALPAPWADADVGAPAVAGSASYSNGVFTVNGSGADIWEGSDQFNYVSQPLTGNASIVARVTSQSDTDPWAKAGVMIKQSTTSGTSYALLGVTPGNGVHFEYGFNTDVGGESYSFPNGWLKLTRTGNTITAFSSADGSTWSPVGATTISLTDPVTIGLFTTSHDASALSTATFDNVSVTAGGSSALPAPWADADVGAPAVAGSASYADGVFTVNGSGADIWEGSDQFNYVSQPLTGNASIVARVTSQSDTDPWAKAGVMIKQSTTSGTSYALLGVTPGNGVHFEYGFNTDVGGESYSFPNGWLKLTRTGNTITAFSSADGSTWSPVGATTISLTDPVTIGLFTTSHDASALSTATFDNVSVTAGGSSALPAPWADADVGAPAVAGSASYADGVFTVSGSGADIWEGSDQFNYVSQPLTGNASIVARVTSQSDTDPWAKAGVMIKQSTTSGTSYALLGVTPGNGIAFQYGFNTTVSGGSYSFPNGWLKLTRSGGTITAYSSADGSTWTQVGTTTISLTDPVTIGLFTCAHNATALSAATFDNVTVTSS